MYHCVEGGAHGNDQVGQESPGGVLGVSPASGVYNLSLEEKTHGLLSRDGSVLSMKSYKGKTIMGTACTALPTSLPWAQPCPALSAQGLVCLQTAEPWSLACTALPGEA